MSPKEALTTAGRNADWIDRAQPNHSLNTLRYEMATVTAEAVCDLAILALDGWMVRVTRGTAGRVRVDLKEPRP